MTDREYQQHPGVNPSSLKVLWSASALHYRYSLDNPREDTEALTIGTATHTAILEPAKFASTYAIRPEGMGGRTKEGREWAASNAGRPCLSWSDYKRITSMAAAVFAHPTAGKIIAAGGAIEQPIYWTDEGTGIVCKGRPDLVLSDGTLVDLKTTRDASPRKFSRDAATLGYHVQLAMYFDGLRANGIEPPNVLIVAVESKAPFDVVVYTVPEDVIQQGREDYGAALVTLAQCRLNGHYAGYSDEPVELVLPRWAVSEEPLDDETMEWLKGQEA